MERKRLLLLAVAVLAGGLAFYLSMRTGPQSGPPPVPERRISQPVRPSQLEVLVATKALQLGARLGAGSLAWQSMPQDRLPEGAILRKDKPEAMAELNGRVVMRPIEGGEPLILAKLGASEEGGALAYMLGRGMRAVSIPLDAKNVRAVSGLIAPRDRVDVVVTRAPMQAGRVDGVEQPARMLFQNVRVLAVGREMSQAGGAGVKSALADSVTLEMSPDQAGRLLTAMRHPGVEVSLILRPVGDTAEAGGAASPGSVMTIRFGRIQ
ncbi:Flp pilus assembly protein CpaB [Xanthobacter sp. TB0139]|uniref:Flp pilus assembly protein CpaB n=1 Tax=Xanthobacter sp. TB0139 TaxID=3459178 RepID=UPI004038FC04